MEQEKPKRAHERKPVVVASYVRRQLPDGGHSLMQFVSSDLSRGGVFIVAENLSLFDLGDEVDIIVEQKKEQYFEGRARVVRSARVFGDDEKVVESGYGLMFLEPSSEFAEMVEARLST